MHLQNRPHPDVARDHPAPNLGVGVLNQGRARAVNGAFGRRLGCGSSFGEI